MRVKDCHPAVYRRMAEQVPNLLKTWCKLPKHNEILQSASFPGKTVTPGPDQESPYSLLVMI